VYVATSREGRRVYVQDRLRGEGALVWRLLEAGAYVYVCGSQPMREGVREAFVDIVGDHGEMTRAGAEAWLQDLETTHKRYRPDLWG
jgi:sulfite reductase alpha subunit-like flavoprotein